MPTTRRRVSFADQTAWDEVRATYKIIEDRYKGKPTAPSLVPLVDLPAVRSLRYAPNGTRRTDFSLASSVSHANRNVKAALLQVSGVEVPNHEACSRCQDGKNLWDVCVAVPNKNSCAGCAYNGQETRCSRQKPGIVAPPRSRSGRRAGTSGPSEPSGPSLTADTSFTSGASLTPGASGTSLPHDISLTPLPERMSYEEWEREMVRARHRVQRLEAFQRRGGVWGRWTPRSPPVPPAPHDEDHTEKWFDEQPRQLSFAVKFSICALVLAAFVAILIYTYRHPPEISRIPGPMRLRIGIY